MVILAFMLFGVMITQILNGYSRWVETEADRFSLQETRKTDDFISVMKKLGELNLAEFDPSWFNEIFFYDHPPLVKRIRFAEQFV